MRALVIGGAGFFGRRIVDALVRKGFHVIVAGRRVPRRALACGFVSLDANASTLGARIADVAPRLLIHCAGPFVPERYPVVAAALSNGCHYLDLAEDRCYVTGIERFDEEARRRGVMVLSGVSSVPGLSSAVVARHMREFERVSAIDIGISSSERVPGIGAVRGVLEQCGRPLPAIAAPPDGGAWCDRFPVRLMPPAGRRLFARCDAPDLDLLPRCLPSLERVTFRAGLLSPRLMAGLRAFARARRKGWIRDPGRWSEAMAAGARLFYPFGNGASGMFVRLRGEAPGGVPLALFWQLVASRHAGVLVPTRGVVAVAQRLREGQVARGARSCCMELEVEDYLAGDAALTTRVDRLWRTAACEDELLWRVG